MINDPSQAPTVAEGLELPVIIKPNIGGSGAKIVKFNSPHDLREASELGFLDLDIDHTALVQEYLPAEGDSIIRVEILGGEYLYAIRLFLTKGEFNLCPADYAVCLPGLRGKGWLMASLGEECRWKATRHPSMFY